MAVSDKTKKRLAQSRQGGGEAFPEQKPDRTHRVLNYPGLDYFYQKLKKEGVGSGSSGGSTVFNGKYVRTINGNSGDVSITASKIGAVPVTRKVNQKALNKDVELSSSDIKLTTSESRTVYTELRDLRSLLETVAENDGSIYSDNVLVELKNWTIIIPFLPYLGLSDITPMWMQVPDSTHKGIREVTYSEWNTLSPSERGYLGQETGELDENGFPVMEERFYQVKQGYAWVSKKREAYWGLSATFDTSSFDPDEEYELLFCNSGDIPPSSYSSSEQANINAVTEGFLWGLEIDIKEGRVTVPVNKRATEYYEEFYSDNPNNLPVRSNTWYQSTISDIQAPSGTIYAVFQKGMPAVWGDHSWYYAMTVNDSVTHYVYAIERLNGGYGQSVGTPLQNGVDITNGKRLLVPIWVNATPDSNFGAQTLSYESTTESQRLKRSPGEFEFLLILAKHTNTNEHRVPPVLFEPGTNAQILGKQGNTSNNGLCRNVSSTGTSITFENASQGTSSSQNSRLIPLAIFGVNLELRGERGPRGMKGDKGDPGERGDPGEPFTYSDFTEEQLAELKGEKGDPFTYEDFTEEQLADLRTNIATADSARTLATPRQIAIFSPSGAVTGHTSFDGSEDVTIEVQHNYMSNEEIQIMLNDQGLTL